MKEKVGEEPSHSEIPAPIMEANLVLSIGEVPQELEAEFERPSNKDQDDNMDTLSVKTTTDQIFDESTEPQTDLDQRKLGLSIVRNLGWSGSNYDDYDVVTVHGICDDYRTAWIDGEGSWWVKTKLFQDLSTRQIDYSYEIHGDSELYEIDGLRLHAERLMTSYAKIRGELEETEKDRPIIWVCHDLGGTIVKEALSMALARPDKFGKIAVQTTSIVFLGTPHRFQSMEDLEDQVLALIMLQGSAIRTQLVRKVKRLANQVERANQKFLSTKLFDRATIFNVFAQNIHDTRNHQLFDGKTPYATVTKNDHDALGAPAADTAFSSLTYAVGHSFESVGRYGLGKLDHLHMVSGDGPDESWVSRIFKMFNMGGCPIKINYQLLPLQASLLSLAPPTRQFDTPYDTMVPKHAIISWIMKQRSFLELRKTDNRPKVIHLHGDGSPQIDIREISQHLYVGYDDSNATSAGYRIPSRSVVYFEFDRLDSRYNSISSMLLYFINILSWRFLTPHNWLGEWENVFRVTKSCSLERIWHLYGEMLPSQDIQELTFFISCFDQCPEEERKWFSQGILSRQGHGEITPSFILSTSRKDDLAIESLPDDRRINLQECPALVRPTIRNMLANEFRSGLINLIARRPVYEIVQLLLETLLEQCSDTPFLGFVILRWLGNYRRGASKSEIAELLRQLSPVTVDNTVRVIISSLGTEDQARAINIYKWIKYAAEPWTAESLSEALTVQQQLSEESTVEKEPLLNDIDPTDLILNIEQVFGGIFIILNRDIKFSHPSFYNVCIDGPVRQDEVEREKVNGEIATACLRYFKLKGAQEKLATLFPGSLDGGPWATLLDAKVIAHQRDSMAEYAIRFWPQHYNASGIFRPSSLVRDLFSDRAARAAWEVPFFFFSNPLTRINRSYVSSLPVFAMLGLEDLIHEDVESHKNLPGFSKDCWYAITEASRVGKKAIVQRLLDQLPVDEDELRNALFWAAAYGKDGTADILIQHIPDLSSFQWPEHILHQAAVAGLDNILAALIKAGHNMNEPGPFWGASAVALAVWGNHTSTVESLIHSDAKIDLSAIDDDGDDALMQAVVMGEPHMVDIILQGGGNVHTKNNRGEGPVYKATVFSRYEALRRLLSANAGFENDQQGDAEDMGIYRRLPLLTAARYGFLECARLLLDASVARQNAHTVTIQGDVLPSTGSSSHTYITRMLLENVPIPPDTTPRSEELLIEAIKSGNVQLVSLLIEHGASINRYEAPLTAAAQNGGVEIVSLLLGKGADVNEVSMDGTRKSPLFWAIFADKVEVARLLLKRDADLSWKTELGWSLLSAAYNTPDLIPELLQKGLDPDYQCVYGSVLHMAARWGYPKTMKVLLEADPRPNLDLVYGDAEIFSESVAAGHIIQNELGLTPLLIACQSHEPECVELLLKAGADPHFHTKNDINASDILMRGGEFEKAARCLEILLSGPYGASAARKVDKKGNTLLHKIEKKTLVSVLQLLVKAGVPVDSKNQDGYTPLAFAVQRSNEAAAKYLIECGATRTGSILHLACLQGSLSLVRLLIQEGADPNAIEPEHGRSLLYTALHIDDEAACSQMVRYLVDEVKVMLDQPGGRFKYPIIRAAHMARGPGSAGLKALKFLIRRKARLDVADDQGRRAIHAAAASEWKDGLCALVEAGVDANVRDKLGRLPIHFAASVRHQDNLEYLLGRFKDINVDAADDDNWTPLLWAARTGVLDNVVQLRQRGADLWVRGRGRVQDFKSEDTWSALKLARFADRDSSWNEHLAPKDGTRINENGDEVEWNDSLHPNKLGDRKLIKCESCFTDILGISWECRKCAGQVSLCFKCFGRREDIHDMGHAFEEIGPLYQQIASPQRRDSIANPVGVGNSSNLADGSRTYEEPETTAGGEVADNLAAVPENDASSDTDLDLDSDDLDSDSDL